MEIRSTTNYGPSVGAKAQTNPFVDLLAGAALSGMASLLTGGGEVSSRSEQNRQIGQSLAKVGYSKAQAA